MCGDVTCRKVRTTSESLTLPKISRYTVHIYTSYTIAAMTIVCNNACICTCSLVSGPSLAVLKFSDLLRHLFNSLDTGGSPHLVHSLAQPGSHATPVRDTGRTGAGERLLLLIDGMARGGEGRRRRRRVVEACHAGRVTNASQTSSLRGRL